MKKSSSNYIFAVGRRKTASSRVRLFKGSGVSMVNDLKVESKAYDKVFEVAGANGKFYFTAKASGGGKEGQTEATILGIARALVKIDAEKYRTPLKKAGLLSRDSRIRQRRMVGTGGKSRRQKQSPKR